MSQYVHRVIGFGGMVGSPLEKIYEIDIPEGEEIMEPKFKWGDLLTAGYVDFKVTRIKLINGAFFYGSETTDWFKESRLKLKKEPKKLYAYEDYYGNVFFNKEDKKHISVEGSHFGANRASEYDIEYNEEK